VLFKIKSTLKIGKQTIHFIDQNIGREVKQGVTAFGLICRFKISRTLIVSESLHGELLSQNIKDSEGQCTYSNK